MKQTPNAERPTPNAQCSHGTALPCARLDRARRLQLLFVVVCGLWSVVTLRAEQLNADKNGNVLPLQSGKAINLPAGTKIGGNVIASGGDVQHTRIVGTTAPLTGGGNLAADLSIGIDRADATHNGYLHRDDFAAFEAGMTTLTYADSIARTVNTISLVNDSDTPGNTKVYGTNSSGVKGWYDLETAGTVLKMNKTLIVDGTYGDDGTGSREHAESPYQTLGAAYADAIAGDTVIVLPGSYTGTDLMTKNVHWHFYPGATVTNSSTTTAIFDDFTGHNFQYVTCKITGSGDFIGGNVTTSNVGSVLNLKTTEHFDTTGSNVVFEANSVTSTSAPIRLHGKTFDVRINRVIQSGATAVRTVQYVRGNGNIQIGELRGTASEAAFSIGGNGITSDEMSRRYQELTATFGSITNTLAGATARGIYLRPIGAEIFQCSVTVGKVEADVLAISTSSAATEGCNITVTAGQITGTINHAGGDVVIRPGVINPKTSGDAVTVSGGSLLLDGGRVDTGGPKSAIGAASEGATLPQSNIYVLSTNTFASTGGTVIIQSSNGPQTVTYTGVSSSGGEHLTGCSGGTGTIIGGGYPIYVYRTGYDLNQTGGTLYVNGFRYDPAKVNGTITHGDPLVAGALQSANNLSDVASPTTALSNIGGQPLDGDLTALAALTGTNTIYYRSGTNTWSPVTVGTGLTFSSGTLSSSGSTGALFANTTSVTVSNTATETTLLTSSATLGANALTAGKTVRVTAFGYFTTKSTSAGTLTLRFKVGSTVAALAHTAIDGYTTANTWRFTGLATCRTTGSSGTIIGQAEDFLSNPAIDAQSTQNTGTVTVNTTTTQAVNLTAQFSVANASNSITCTNLVIETL